MEELIHCVRRLKDGASRLCCGSALSTEGKYLGTLTDGDVLWGLKELNFPSLYQMEEIPVMQVNRSRDNKPVHVDVDMEGLLEKGQRPELRAGY